MSATVDHLSMGRVAVTTRDREGRERTYEFRPNRDGLGVEPTDDGYTPVVLQALWEDGVVVDWSPDDLTPSERAQLDAFCDDCGSAENQQRIGPDEWRTYCPECDGDDGEQIDASA